MFCTKGYCTQNNKCHVLIERDHLFFLRSHLILLKCHLLATVHPLFFEIPFIQRGFDEVDGIIGPPLLPQYLKVFPPKRGWSIENYFIFLVHSGVRCLEVTAAVTKVPFPTAI